MKKTVVKIQNVDEIFSDHSGKFFMPKNVFIDGAKSYKYAKMIPIKLKGSKKDIGYVDISKLKEDTMMVEIDLDEKYYIFDIFPYGGIHFSQNPSYEGVYSVTKLELEHFYIQDRGENLIVNKYLSITMVAISLLCAFMLNLNANKIIDNSVIAYTVVPLALMMMIATVTIVSFQLYLDYAYSVIQEKRNWEEDRKIAQAAIEYREWAKNKN